MRYTIEVVRTQTVERTVRAADDEAAYAKVQMDIDKPYGIDGSTTKSIDMHIVSVDQTVAGLQVANGQAGGPELYSVKGASAQLGISPGLIYELLRSGELEHLSVGRRRLISRAAIEKFIDSNTKCGYQS